MSRPPPILRAVLTLTVRRTGPGTAQVTGGQDPHGVTFGAGRPSRCDCRAAQYRPGVPCSHVLALALRRGHPRAWRLLRAVLRHGHPHHGGTP